jgi:PEP-CTERM motif
MPSLDSLRSTRLPMRFAATVLSLSAAVGAAHAAGSTLPGALTLVQSNARVQWGGPGLGQNSLNHPSFVTAAAGGATAETDVAGGTAKALSIDVGNPSGIVTYAYSNFEVLFQNTGPVAIGFGAGAINATVDASFLHTLGTDAFGTAAHILTASLYGQGGGLNSGAGVSYQAAVFNRSSSPTLDFRLLPNAGFIATGSADLAALSVALAFPAFSLQPGETLRVGLNLTTNAWGYAPGGGPWSATTDAFNTASVSMLLPAGTELVSQQPLSWVTVVPEPSSGALLLAGLLGLACWRAWPRRRAGRVRVGLVAALGLAAAGAGHAQITVIDHEVAMQLRGPGLPNTTPRDPWILSGSASGPAGSSSATADLTTGDFKVASSWTGAVESAIVHQARVVALIEFRNDTALGIGFAAGAIHANLTGTAGWTTGRSNFGISNQLYSRLQVTAPGIAGGRSNSVLSYDQNQEGFDTTEVATPAGASVAIHSVSLGGIDATLGVAAFTLAPGEAMRLSFEFEAQSRGTNGWSAFVDAFNSAHLAMQLPAGVTLASPQRLSWVSVVPEPGAAWLWSAGLAGLLALRGYRARKAATSRWN